MTATTLTPETLLERQRAYAQLIVKRGINLSPGQTVIVQSDLDAAPFVRIFAEELWAAGAKDVMFNWGDDSLGEMRLRNASIETLTDIPAWKAASQNDYANEDTCWALLHTVAPPPEGLDPEKLSAYSQAFQKAIKPMSDARMQNIVRWNIVAIPTQKWANWVYPEIAKDDEDAALMQLWHDVLTCTRTLEGDPEKNWDEHVSQSFKYRDWLTEQEFTELHFTSDLGTDLHVGLPDGYRFLATQETSPSGVSFIANMPSEEIFSAPHRERVNGRVVCSKPLFYNNVQVEGLEFTFEDGVAVDFKAAKGGEIIERLLDVDEGSKRLGEVALVPFDSAVSNTGRLFYTTLFDENAACHLALGESYPETLTGGLEMDKDELLSHGMNQSLEHVDFMFGTADMNIVGTTKSGEQIQVFKDGNFAF